MNISNSQELESYIPVYDVIPEKWEDARPPLTEFLKKITNSLNVKGIGFYLDEELLSGKSFIPGQTIMTEGGDSQQFRTILRKVIEFPGLSIGANTQPHGINIDANFSLIQLYANATDATALTGNPIPNGLNTITYNSTNIIITVQKTYTRCWAIIEYIQEL